MENAHDQVKLTENTKMDKVDFRTIMSPKQDDSEVMDFKSDSFSDDFEQFDAGNEMGANESVDMSMSQDFKITSMDMKNNPSERGVSGKVAGDMQIKSSAVLDKFVSETPKKSLKNPY